MLNVPVRSYVARRWKQWLLLFCTFGLIFLIDRGLRLYYYSQSYNHHRVGEVYYEDEKTALFFDPDRYLFWRYKPDIRVHLTTPAEEFDLYHVGSRMHPHNITIETNSRGFRAPEFDCEKAPSTFRIFTLGDSRTMGVGVERDERYSERLAKLLDSESDGVGYQVINVGTDGYTSYQGRVLLERELVECEPDLVTVLFGVNDQDWDENIRDVDKAELFDNPAVTLSQWANRSTLVYFIRFHTLQIKGSIFGKTRRIPTLQTSSVGRIRKVPLDDYALNLHYIHDLGMTYGFQTVYLVVPDSPYAFYAPLHSPAPRRARPRIARAQEYERNGEYERCVKVLTGLLARMSDVAVAHYELARCYQHLERWEEAHTEFLLKSEQSIFREYEEVVRDVAHDTGSALVDLTPEFTAMTREPLYYDVLHPNARGNEIIANGIFEALQARPGLLGHAPDDFDREPSGHARLPSELSESDSRG
jgi:lysophospholipase L1-like esterase